MTKWAIVRIVQPQTQLFRTERKPLVYLKPWSAIALRQIKMCQQDLTSPLVLPIKRSVNSNTIMSRSTIWINLSRVSNSMHLLSSKSQWLDRMLGTKTNLRWPRKGFWSNCNKYSIKANSLKTCECKRITTNGKIIILQVSSNRFLSRCKTALLPQRPNLSLQNSNQQK